MTNEQRQTEINETLLEINKLTPEWSYLSVKIQTKTFIDANDEIAIHKQWNELDNILHALRNKLRSLQTEYAVDFIGDDNILRTALLRLNHKVEINTHTNGWTRYMHKPEVRQLLIEIHGLLLLQCNRPGICNVVSE